MTSPASSEHFAAQPEDWTERGAHPVVAGVTRIPLPMPSTGLKAVNIYVVDDGNGATIIDSGWDIPATHRQLRQSLRLLGMGTDDIREVLVTHAHHDHYTAALALRNTVGCRVRLGRGERSSLHAQQQLRDSYRLGPVTSGIAQVDLLLRHGAPAHADAFRRIRNHELEIDDSTWGTPDAWLDDEQELDLGRRSLRVLATPGHTRGHVVFRDGQHGLLFAGDHVLPHITPSIGFEAAPERLPLVSYLASLRLLRDRDDTVLLPAHGPATDSTHTRIDELLEHHTTRFEQILTRIATGDSTAAEVARSLRWTRHERAFPEMDEFNQCLAILETGAHLDLLVMDGHLTVQESEGGVHTYTERGIA